MDHWRGHPDYWDDFEFKAIIEAIWEGYRDKTDELRMLLRQLDDSKSVFTLPYMIEKRWLRVIFDAGSNVSRPLTGDQLLEIPRLVDDGYVTYPGEFHVDREANAVVLEEAPAETLKLWAPVYYVHNPVILSFWMNLLGLGDLATRFERVYNVKPYSGTFYRVVKGLWYVFVSGPTIQNISVGVSILFNMPVALRAGVVTKVEDSGTETVIEVTPDEKIGPAVDRWEFSSNLIPLYKVGDRVEAGTHLVHATTQLMDYINSPEWWRMYMTETEQKKLELVEKYCTTLARISAENYFRDRHVEGVENSQAFLQEYINHVLPDYVSLLLLLFNSWVDFVDLDDDPSTAIRVKFVDALGKDADCIPLSEVSRTQTAVNPFVKHDGEWPFQNQPTRRNHLNRREILRSRGRLFLPKNSVVERVYFAESGDAEIVAQGPFWVDINYEDIDEDVFVDYWVIDYSIVGGEEKWVKELYIQEWAFAHGYDAKTKKLTLLGNNINQVIDVKVPSEPLKPWDRVLVEGVDYEVRYNRSRIGDGTIDIIFLGDEIFREVYVDVLALPCWPTPVDDEGNPDRVDVGDSLAVKLRLANEEDAVYDRGKFYYKDFELVIGGDLPIYDGEYKHDGEIDYGYERDGHFYVKILML